MERVLYNGFAAATSTEGDRFFYVNPLQRRADHFEGDDRPGGARWYSCACCPPNIMRTFASLEHYLAAVTGDILHLHHFTGAQVSTSLAGGILALDMVTDYPWSGTVTLRVTSAPLAGCGLAIRVPGWSSNPKFLLNDAARGGHRPARLPGHPASVAAR